jgi:predicted transcriptional regulator
MPGISAKKVRELFEEGYTQKEIADLYNVHESTISRKINQLQVYRTAAAATEGRLSLEEDVNVMEELKDLYKRSEKLLSQLEKVWNGEADLEELQDKLGKTSLTDALVKTHKEVRNYLGLMTEISKALYNVRQVQEFQSIVISEIKKIDPELSQKIVKRLVELNSLNDALDQGND